MHGCDHGLRLTISSPHHVLSRELLLRCPSRAPEYRKEEVSCATFHDCYKRCRLWGARRHLYGWDVPLGDISDAPSAKPGAHSQLSSSSPSPAIKPYQVPSKWDDVALASLQTPDLQELQSLDIRLLVEHITNVYNPLCNVVSKQSSELETSFQTTTLKAMEDQSQSLLFHVLTGPSWQWISWKEEMVPESLTRTTGS